jgi:hypothetical protein
MTLGVVATQRDSKKRTKKKRYSERERKIDRGKKKIVYHERERERGQTKWNRVMSEVTWAW